MVCIRLEAASAINNEHTDAAVTAVQINEVKIFLYFFIFYSFTSCYWILLKKQFLSLKEIKIDHDQYYYITYFGIIQHFCKLFTKCLQLLSDIDTSKKRKPL